MADKSRKANILFLEGGSGQGGSSKALLYLLKYLDNNKFRLLVAFLFFNSGPDTQMIMDLDVPVFFLSAIGDPFGRAPLRWLSGTSTSILLHKIRVVSRFLLQLVLVETPHIFGLYNLIRKKAVDLVVLNNDIHHHIAGILAAKLTGTPCICIKAGGIGEGRTMKKFLTPYVDLVIATSKATAEDQVRNNHATKRVEIVSRGIDLKKFNPETRFIFEKDHFRIPHDNKVVASISRFDTGKGQVEFLEAAAEVLKIYKDVYFVLVGDGDMMEILHEKAMSLQISDHVFFTGWQLDIRNILSMIDIFVHCPTTWIEGLGIANLEAMAMGKPTIVSRNGGLTDVVIDGVTGIVVIPNDIEGLSQAILRLLQDEEFSRRLGENARKRVEDQFDSEKNAEKIGILFDEYLHKRPASPPNFGQCELK